VVTDYVRAFSGHCNVRVCMGRGFRVAIAACGVVWCGVVWCGVVWCGVVWCGVVWCGVVWCGVVWCGVVCFNGHPMLAMVQTIKDVNFFGPDSEYVMSGRYVCFGPTRPQCTMARDNLACCV
jgi:hypothetical protein